MPRLKWSELTPMQLGRYAEYYAKMEFASYGFEVYSSEVDDHGVDFVAKSPSDNVFYEVQVKSTRRFNPVIIPESKMPELKEERLVCYLHFTDGRIPDFFVIPSLAWNFGDNTLVYRKYDNGQKSKPEYAINISKEHLNWLKKYSSDLILDKITKKRVCVMKNKENDKHLVKHHNMFGPSCEIAGLNNEEDFKIYCHLERKICIPTKCDRCKYFAGDEMGKGICCEWEESYDHVSVEDYPVQHDEVYFELQRVENSELYEDMMRMVEDGDLDLCSAWLDLD